MSATDEETAKHTMPEMPRGIGNPASTPADPLPHRSESKDQQLEHGQSDKNLDDISPARTRNSKGDSEAGSDSRKVDVLTLRPGDVQYPCEFHSHF